nr:hypothetical protein Iba_chr12cCG22610 [Ipomoea batatas]
MQYDIYGGGATVLKTHLLLLCGLLCEQSLHSSEVLGLGYLQGIKLDYCCSLGSFANVLNKVICGVNCGKPQNQYQLSDKPPYMMRIWLCKM